jgi:Mg2+ and Co2+ transporter CorA
LEKALSLVAVKQARISGKIAELQWKDAQLTLKQGESIRRLTIVNMVYLPATFIAVRSASYFS